MKVVLSSSSIQALARIEGLNAWDVGPTMTRGQGKKRILAFDKEQPAAAAPPPKKDSKKVVKSGLKQKKEEKPVVEPSCPENPGAENYKRNDAGKTAMRVQLRRLNKIHNELYSHSPVFDLQGLCRMGFEGAHNQKWTNILEFLPDFLSASYLF